MLTNHPTLRVPLQPRKKTVVAERDLNDGATFMQHGTNTH